MNPPSHRVRRATLDDIGALKALWQAMRFPCSDLEKRLTEFQVVEAPDGKVVGALGFQIAERQACIHSEAFEDFSIADAVRPLLWERIRPLAMNHGVVRLWTREHVPFWTHNGFQPADAAAMERFPSGWDRSAPNWLTLQLKNEEALATVDKEFRMFMESEKQRSARSLDQARTLKVILTVAAFLVAAAVLAMAAYVFFKRRGAGPLPP